MQDEAVTKVKQKIQEENLQDNKIIPIFLK